MRALANLFKFLSVYTLTVLLGAVAAFAGAQKTTLCHVPPGNTDNAHEIVVSESALASHLENHEGDAVGTCLER